MTLTTTSQAHYRVEVRTDFDIDEQQTIRDIVAINKATGERTIPPISDYDPDPHGLFGLWLAAGSPPRRRIGRAGFNWDRDALVEAVRGLRKVV